jgi:hypothetical protein
LSNLLCSTASAIVFIGRNRRGQWVALQQDGLYGGLFVDRTQAIKYALFENGHHRETIIELARGIELDTPRSTGRQDIPFDAACSDASLIEST